MRRRGLIALALAAIAGAAACATPTTTPAPDAAEAPDAGADVDAPPPLELVPITLATSVILPTNAGRQIDDLFHASVTAGSALARMRIFARFCADAACAQPLALVPATVPSAGGDGYVLLTTASASGGGFATAITIDRAPRGASYLQLVGDTQRSEQWGKGTCTSAADCPGDLDLLMTDAAVVSTDADLGSARNPVPATRAIQVDGAGQTVSVGERLFLGHLVLHGTEIHTAAPADGGRLVVAISNEAHTHRNRIALVDLGDLSGSPGASRADSYDLRHAGAPYAGDICGMVSGGGRLFAVGVGAGGAHVFELVAATGQQLSETPVATFPSTAAGTPHPCRGVFARKGGHDHLYLVSYEGAGALDRSRPHPLHHVNLTTGATATPLDVYIDMAWRAIAVDAAATRLYVADMSWSKDSVDQGVRQNRIFAIALGPDGAPGGVVDSVVTATHSDERCGSTNHWPTALVMAMVGGQETLLLGHDTGVAAFAPSDLTAGATLDLRGFGRMIAQVERGPGGLLYAMPQCKAFNADSDFVLPYGAGTEAADKNLVAVIDPSGASLAVAATSLDIDGDGTPDHGVDFDYYHLKRYLRGFATTLPIPPVVYVGPQLAVGSTLLFVRGTGIGGGLGQVQDVGVFSLASGHGIVFDGYEPLLDGLSAEAGTGTGIWGYDLWPGVGSSVGWVHYIP